MAAPSVGRRSCTGQKKAAALIVQSRRFRARQMGCCTTAFFFCRRPADYCEGKLIIIIEKLA